MLPTIYLMLGPIPYLPDLQTRQLLPNVLFLVMSHITHFHHEYDGIHSIHSALEYGTLQYVDSLNYTQKWSDCVFLTFLIISFTD